MATEHRFEDPSALATTLAKRVADALRAGLATRAGASLVVSGGRSPAPLFEALCSQHLDWSRVTITLADERWVDEPHPDSNAASVRRHLLQDRAGAAQFIPLKNDADTSFAGEARCGRALAGMARPFDMVLLGMGKDGHTASLFPKSPQLPQALAMDSRKLCVGIDPVTAPHSRMTLTLPTLLDSRHIAVLFSGAAKWAVYARALQRGPVEDYPIRAILQQSAVPVDIYYHE
jgi:6-phosphogluconolactonase